MKNIVILTGIIFIIIFIYYKNKDNPKEIIQQQTVHPIKKITKKANVEIESHAKEQIVLNNQKNESPDFIVEDEEEKKEETKFNLIAPDNFNIETSFENNNYFMSFLNSFYLQDYDKTIKYAENLLKVPSRYASNHWYGRICHGTNIILGKTYLAKGNIKKAESYLMKSVDKVYINQSRGQIFSPTLSSFGPDRSLAYDLYKKGRKQIVIKYFEATKRFWKHGIEDGIIEKAINNVKGTNSGSDSYFEEDDPNFPFMRWVFVDWKTEWKWKNENKNR